jgi:hypothetical protein
MQQRPSKAHLALFTTALDATPLGLSTTNQLEMSRPFLFLRPMA